jgi:RNA polymerase sigma-54 factor
MAHSFSQSLVQQMRMEQRLTPQLIQCMAVLQKPVAELETYVNEALESNPALEVAEPQGTSPSSQAAKTSKSDRRTPADQDGFGRLNNFYRSFDSHDDDRPTRFSRRIPDSGEGDPKLGAMANTPGRGPGLNEYLLNQWAVVELDEDLRRAGAAIINNLDPDGYLRAPLERIATDLRPSMVPEKLAEALRHVQRLDPPGVGARDVKECLLLQLQALPGDNQIERALIERHLDDVAHNRLPNIAKATGYSLGEINEALRALRSVVSLHPGYQVASDDVPPIRPDVIVEYAETGGGLTVRLARGNLPKLRINDEVAALAKSKVNEKADREFLRKQVEAASFVIDAVSFRNERLLQLAKALVERQREFFDRGPEGLRVLRMGDLAQELGCDPSTISRAVADKYMQTPRGIYSLRSFFTGGTETEDGESIGWDNVRSRVRELVEAEDRKNPLKDDQIVDLLKKEGITLSRRTVAKYRAQLDIPSAGRRKVY